MSIWPRISSAIQVLLGGDPCAEITKERGQWESKHRELESDHGELNTAHVKLGSDHAELNTAHVKLESDHAELNTAHAKLENDHAELISNHANKLLALEAEKAQLQDELATLRSSVDPSFEIIQGVQMSKDDVMGLVRGHLPAMNFELLDVSYWVPGYEDVTKIIEWDKVDSAPYIPERRDCDDYGMYMAAMASVKFGVNPFLPYWDYDAKHFYNLIITAEEDLYVFEPQTDQIWHINEFEPDGLHRLERGKVYGF